MTTEPAAQTAGSAPSEPGGTGGGESPPSTSTSTGPRSKAKVSFADATFKNVTRLCGFLLLALMAAIALFLVLKATDALGDNKANFFTTETWFPNESGNPRFGIAALLFGTVVTAAVAMIIAVPVAVGIALYITNYAPRRVGDALGYIVDLLAAVPSVIYGLWGLAILAPHMNGTQLWLSQYLPWFPWTPLGGAILGLAFGLIRRAAPTGSSSVGTPITLGVVLGVVVSLIAGIADAPDDIGIFSTPSGQVGRSIFVAGIVLAIMVLPIVAAISREVFKQVPIAHKEAAFALGATRWEMIRTAVLPYGKPGVISASMLGLGRAMGETIAVALVLPASFGISVHFLEPAGNTIAANIANGFGDSNDTGRGALIASGLVLFIVTMLVNIAARAIIARRAEFSGAAS
ncbi:MULTISPECIES: PstC family ABC transporter permease [unclassified Pseudofrankia]|uniref:PstC family ABC transporter permease n=1 Tax=unclassified Pseudofrankia TaxID=2994372 RepID=UPI0008DA8D48|nr:MULTISPECIES: ABC transporter permease subunit [unclassified Pseudofrankia]MDT3441729.1 ABC transporter permease subunit [Pseudofrankia sp. BMG5.37]OHV47047.1 phosphate ABC transporter permease [Pseudofrankia sp. BMG5.36]